MDYDYSKLPLSARGCLIIVFSVPITLLVILYVINEFVTPICCGGM